MLVIERSSTVRAPGKFCFPGGGVEPGESDRQAVVRELQEELNVAVTPVRKIWQNYTQSGVKLHWWLLILPEGEHPKPNPNEVAAWFWMNAAELNGRRETLLTNREFLKAVAKGEIDLSVHP